MRIFILIGLAAGAITVFAPKQGAGLLQSVVHGFGWGIGREIAHNILGYHHWRRRSWVAWERGKRAGERTSSSGLGTAKVRP